MSSIKDRANIHFTNSFIQSGYGADNCGVLAKGVEVKLFTLP
jgi:hypothetical protein